MEIKYKIIPNSRFTEQQSHDYSTVIHIGEPGSYEVKIFTTAVHGKPYLQLRSLKRTGVDKVDEVTHGIQRNMIKGDV